MFGTGASPRTETIIRPVGKRSETTGRGIPSDAIRPKCSKIHRLRKPFWHVPQSDPQVTCEAACRSRLFSACYSRSEEHTSELQSLMRISYAVFCLKNKTKKLAHTYYIQIIKNTTDKTISNTTTNT